MESLLQQDHLLGFVEVLEAGQLLRGRLHAGRLLALFGRTVPQQHVERLRAVQLER